MRACVLMLLLFFDCSIPDAKPVAAHCPVISLSRRDIACDQAPTMRACVLMLLLFFDFSITDVKPVTAHCPVVNLSCRDIACDQATTMRACVLMLFLCLDFSVTDVELAAAHCSVIHLSIGYRALHGRLTVRAYVLACLGALLPWLARPCGSFLRFPTGSSLACSGPARLRLISAKTSAMMHSRLRCCTLACVRARRALAFAAVPRGSFGS